MYLPWKHQCSCPNQRHASHVMATGGSRIASPAYLANLCAARAHALAASSARFFGGAFVSNDMSSFLETAVISSTAARNAASLAFDGLLKPLTFLTNWREAARISSSVTGGSKLKRVLIFLHMSVTPAWCKGEIRIKGRIS